MIKYFILIFLLPIFLYSSEHHLLLSGFTKHIDKDLAGYQYNEFNLGFGYEYSTYNKDESQWYNSYKISIINDSYKNPFPFIGYSREYKFENLPISLSLDFFLGYKKMAFYDSTFNKDKTIYEYKPIAGILPTLKYYYKDISVDIAYAPHIKLELKDNILTSPSFVYLYFSINLPEY